ncbi:unnamed protein product [Absidia cylindrospora]
MFGFFLSFFFSSFLPSLLLYSSMQAVHNFLFSHNDHSTPKLTLPPLVVDGKPMLKSVEWLSKRTNTLPAFLEPQPQTTMDQQHEAIQHPRPHRLSLSSLSSISTESSFEDDQTPQQFQGTGKSNLLGTAPFEYSETAAIKSQQEQSRNLLPLPTMIGSAGTNAYDTSMNQRQLAQINQCHENVTTDHRPHVASALDHDRRRPSTTGSLSPRSENLDGKLHQLSVSQDHPPPASTSGSSSTDSLSVDSSPSPSSPLPSSLMTFWALPTSANNEQQHEFVTKNAHIKRPRNAWIHFRCYFGQSLKAKDPTIRAEEISK